MATGDADRGVRVATISLVDNIRKRDLLEPEDIDTISVMIFDVESRIRRAVAPIFLSNVEVVYEETLEGIGGNVEKVEDELGDERDTQDGIPYSWLKYNALVKVLTKFDRVVDEKEQEENPKEEEISYKILELGQVESRISQAASAIVAEMRELNVSPYDTFITSGLGESRFLPFARPLLSSQRAWTKR
jgi:cohesin complex subunit SA-1/2